MGDGASVGTKWVYSFGGGNSDGSAAMKNLLGGKGANLAEMASLGLPVPPGFTLTTEVCTAYYDLNEAYPDGLTEQVDDALKMLEQKTGKIFGDAANPLLVSLRSGAYRNEQRVRRIAKDFSGFLFEHFQGVVDLFRQAVRIGLIEIVIGRADLCC